MKGEVNKDFFCSANKYNNGACLLGGQSRCKQERKTCGCHHRKHPTLEQFLGEYGDYWTGPMYLLNEATGKWEAWSHLCYLNRTIMDEAYKNKVAVCACTPFGSPDEDWRP